MVKVYFPSDYLVTAADMNDMETTLASASIVPHQLILQSSGGYNADASARYTVVKGGVFGKPSDASLNTNLKFYTQGGDGYVAAGNALDAKGRIITVPSAFQMNIAGADANYIWTDNGDDIYYAKIEYSGSVGIRKTDDFAVEQPTRETDSYYISVENNTTLSADQIMIGSCVSFSGVYSAFIDYRNYVQPLAIAGKTVIDPGQNPISSITTLQDHVNAVGSGTPTPSNPHGLSPGDVGALPEDIWNLYSTISFPSATPLGMVYQNTSLSAAFVQAIASLPQGYNLEPNTMQSLSLYIASDGTTGDVVPPTGSLISPIEVARAGFQYQSRGGTDYMIFRLPLVGFVPSGWFYRFDRTPDINDGTVNSISYITKQT